MTPQDYLHAARVPAGLKPQAFGLWRIERLDVPRLLRAEVGWPEYTLLWRTTERTLHHGDHRELVMEDSLPELRRHLPIWLAAHGRVLVTGLGLGCVVRGLLASPAVEHIDVVEIDAGILRVVGPEFASIRRVAIHQGDALTTDIYPGETGRLWDFAWHDLWTDGEEHLQCLHARLIVRYRDRARRQGAWAFPREVGRKLARQRGLHLLGAPRR